MGSGYCQVAELEAALAAAGDLGREEAEALRRQAAEASAEARQRADEAAAAAAAIEDVHRTYQVCPATR